jgi:hypothetical protein
MTIILGGNIMKRKTLVFSLVLVSILALSACGSDILNAGGNQYIDIVKEGTFYDYPDEYVGDAFDDFFANPSWEYFVSENDEDIVEFTGEAEYMGESVDICIQFQVDPDTEEFEVIWSDINEYEMSLLEYNDLIDTVYSE